MKNSREEVKSYLCRTISTYLLTYPPMSIFVDSCLISGSRSLKPSKRTWILTKHCDEEFCEKYPTEKCCKDLTSS